MNADRIDKPPLDDGWDALAQAWQQIAPPSLEQAPAELRRAVLRTDLRFRFLAALEVLCYLGLIALVVVYLRERKGPAAFLWGFMMMCFVAWGLDYAVRIRRGLWQAADASTAAWLELLAARCARKRQYLRTSWVAVIVMLACMLAMFGVFRVWFPEDYARVAAQGWRLAGVWAATLGIQYLWSSWYRRQIAAEERWIAALRDEGAADG